MMILSNKFINTFFARSPVQHGQVRIVFVRLSSPDRLLVERADRVVARPVAAAHQLRLTAGASILTLK